MKLHSILLLFSGSFLIANAQPDATFVAEGRAALAAKNLPGATAAFRSAVEVNAGNSEAQALYAVTRILNLVNEDPVNTLLDRLNVSSEGRNLYDWTTTVTEDDEGYVPPSNFSASELTAFARNTVLEQISAAADAMALITDPSFILNLTAEETTIEAVTLDLGDIRMIEAMLRSAEYLIYTIHSWNLDIQLTAIRQLLLEGFTSSEDFFASYPNFLRFATTEDLDEARDAFSEAVSAYTAASGFIRNRAPLVERLFDFDVEHASDEERFRMILEDLKSSLAQATESRVDEELTFNLARHFDGSFALRDLLPAFSSEGIVAGSWPDAEFGGVVTPLTVADVEDALASVVLLRIAEITATAATWEITGRGAPGTCALLGSVNLTTWNEVDFDESETGIYEFSVPRGVAPVRYFILVQGEDTTPPTPVNLAPATFAGLTQNRTYVLSSFTGTETLTFPTTSSFSISGQDSQEPYTISGTVGNASRSGDGNAWTFMLSPIEAGEDEGIMTLQFASTTSGTFYFQPLGSGGEVLSGTFSVLATAGIAPAASK